MGPGNRPHLNKMAMNQIKATFKGIPGEKVDSVEMFGMTFQKGKTVKVPYPSHAARKLAGNPYFETEGEQVTDADIKSDMEALTSAATLLRQQQKEAVERNLTGAEAQVEADMKKGQKDGGNTATASGADPAKARSGGGAGSTEFG